MSVCQVIFLEPAKSSTCGTSLVSRYYCRACAKNLTRLTTLPPPPSNVPLPNSPLPSFSSLPPPIYSFIDPSDLRIATLLTLLCPEYTGPILPGCFTVGSGPIYLPILRSFLNVAPPNIIIPCFTPVTDYPLAIPIEFL